jgi:hypothetical protein
VHPVSARSITSLLAATLLLSPSSFAFDTTLSDTAVREAYFLGQRQDESLPLLLEKYTRRLPAPQTGPHIASIAFFTPFTLFAEFSSRHHNDYSAQQAQLDHRALPESVKIIVTLHLTDSYGPFVASPASQDSGSPADLCHRPSDFWRDFQVQVFNNDKELSPAALRGKPQYNCGRYGNCTLTGATIELEFPAESFALDTATIRISPPEGDRVSAEFDLTRLR